ncbi:MAG: UDP-N-acetylglucosamine 2-epimerase [Candidatus Omnitrophota bacterium]|nr:UDP-N-acetylglucosamine 2-epimerase [Candidatus Omnitrophota bacterium]
MKRKVCVITGSRSDYGILQPVMKAIKKSKRLELFVIATSMHLMKEFGYTVREIEKDGFHINNRINISYWEDTGHAMAFSVGKAVSMFSDSFLRLKPDIVLVLGDRGEMLAAAIAANYMNIPVAHIHGGEVSGHIDGLVRHAITKLSNIHFPATDKAKERIKKLGERPDTVFKVGAPALDSVLSGRYAGKKELLKKYGLNDGPTLIVVQHPVSAETGKSASHMRTTLEAVKELQIQTIVIYSNADAGGRKMIDVIKRYERHSLIKAFKSIPHADYLGLMRISSVLVGNSSSGIIEAASFKLPVVNIGDRQRGRERCGNVIDADHGMNAILRAIKKALFDKKFRNKVRHCNNPYGDGHAGQRIADRLAAIRLNKELLVKQLTY